ncbi:long-chain fatty acid--CoA ligase [Candidatus Falkowbacteria bacterium]|nr:long-chain fatty acid--CoA ligase [Candidatus Falkowbacteria bacterium]
MNTLYLRFREVAQRQPSRPMVKFKSGNDWQEWSYGECLSRIDSLAAGLSKIGLVAGDRAIIMSENRPEWLFLDLAMNKLGVVSVPVHTSSNFSFIEYVVKDSGARQVFLSNAFWKKHGSEFKRLLDQYGLTIYIKDLIDRVELDDHQAKLLSSLLVDAETECSSEELASIIYTSGTTGEPKGVMLSNNNIISDVDASLSLFTVDKSDIFLSFLPLSHVLERTAGQFVPLFAGATIAYAEGISKLSKNLQEIRPTILISVPKIFERMLERVFAEMKSRPKIVQKMFFCTLKKRPHVWNQQIVDYFFKKRISAIFGGRLKFAICGGAAINERVLRFFKNMDIAIAEGYGLTETSPVVAVNRLGRSKVGTVGQPLSCVEVKIAKDKEVLVRGLSVMMGYWQKPELTNEAFDEDGWFKTGDLGFLDSENYLTIIGRKKDIVVLTNGKNIFPERIETELNLSPYIAQSVVVGHRMPSLGAIIIPDYDLIKQEFGEKYLDIKGLIKEEIGRINAKLAPYENIREFSLLEKPFTIEKDELTATLKVRRHVIEKHYGKEIEALYRRAALKK